MLVKCKCDKCSGELAFLVFEVGGVAKCPSCGGETELVAPPIPPTSAASANRCFFVWLDDKAEGPLREDQLLDLSAKFPAMSWCRPDDGRWRQLSSFAQDLKTASEKKVAEEKNAVRKEGRITKLQLQQRKREITAKMTEIRAQARLESAQAGKSWLGLYDSYLAADQRRNIRYQKEMALKNLEQEKQSIEQAIMKVDKILLGLESEQPSS